MWVLPLSLPSADKKPFPARARLLARHLYDVAPIREFASRRAEVDTTVHPGLVIGMALYALTQSTWSGLLLEVLLVHSEPPPHGLGLQGMS